MEEWSLIRLVYDLIISSCHCLKRPFTRYVRLFIQRVLDPSYVYMNMIAEQQYVTRAYIYICTGFWLCAS